MLETLGRLTSDDTIEWVEPESKEVELIEREGPGDGGSEDTLEGTSSSAKEREREREIQLQTEEEEPDYE